MFRFTLGVTLAMCRNYGSTKSGGGEVFLLSLQGTQTYPSVRYTTYPQSVIYRYLPDGESNLVGKRKMAE